MKVTTKGQVTIPLEIRERLSIHPGTDVEFAVEGNKDPAKQPIPRYHNRDMVPANPGSPPTGETDQRSRRLTENAEAGQHRSARRRTPQTPPVSGQPR
ncbi:MAG TPA: AbrB/MazE/SpoVT family DNA-binding domain-containing protein [Candidatus Methylomirabilis sp.]